MEGYVTEKESIEACGCALIVGIGIGLGIASAIVIWQGLLA